jgi:hypothetical protein
MLVCAGVTTKQELFLLTPQRKQTLVKAPSNGVHLLLEYEVRSYMNDLIGRISSEYSNKNSSESNNILSVTSDILFVINNISSVTSKILFATTNISCVTSKILSVPTNILSVTSKLLFMTNNI